MFVVNVMPNNSNANISLAYKTEDRAKIAYAMITKAQASGHVDGGWAVVDDDFGNEVRIEGKFISHVVLIDVARSQWREYEIQQCVERTRVLLSKRSPLIAA